MLGWENEKKVIKLQYPVKWGEEPVSEIEFRAMRTEDILELEFEAGKMKTRQFIEIAGRICEHEGGEILIKSLHPSDSMKIIELVGNFMGGSQDE